MADSVHAQHLRTLNGTEPLRFHKLADFDPDWRLKPEVEPLAPGHPRVTRD